MSSDKKVELGGWILFVLSAVFYGISNLNSGQLVSLAGSVTFIVACAVFIFLRLQQPE